MRRLASLLALLLPALSFGAGTVRVVPELVLPACSACGLGAGALGRPALTASLTPALNALPTLTPFTGPTAVAAANAPAAANEQRLIVPGRAAQGGKLIVATGADVDRAIATAQAADAAEKLSAEHAPPDAALMALFDGAKPEGAEGDFAPRVLMPGALSDGYDALAASVRTVRAEVDRATPALRESVRKGAWLAPQPTTLDGPCCGDAAPKLAALLRMRGIPAMLVEAEFHFYVVVRTPQGDIVVDPTVRQFFGREKAPAGVPQVFVGSWGALELMFAGNLKHKTTRYNVARIYRGEARAREDLLRATAEAYAAPALASEYAELRDAARGPRDVPPPPRSLIVP